MSNCSQMKDPFPLDLLTWDEATNCQWHERNWYQSQESCGEFYSGVYGSTMLLVGFCGGLDPLRYQCQGADNQFKCCIIPGLDEISFRSKK